MIWASLLHLGFNMWSDRPVDEWGPLPKKHLHFVAASPELRFDEDLWKTITARMADAGMNMVLIDLGEAVKYRSHPEIAVKGAWTPKRLQRELQRLRGIGLEPIPKLNFSTAHDAWLGPYARMVSTDAYYAVVRDLIAEVIDIFEKPRFFHLGMDEETAAHQRKFAYAVMRQYDLWWHDLYFMIDCVEKGNVRPWVWSDYIWQHRDEYLKKMPRSVLQSNWYYGRSFSRKLTPVQAYLDLEAKGFDQVPTASNWGAPENFANTVRFCRRNILPERLQGFMQTPWMPTLPEVADHHLQAVDLVAGQIAKIEKS